MVPKANISTNYFNYIKKIIFRVLKIMNIFLLFLDTFKFKCNYTWKCLLSLDIKNIHKN